MLNRQKHEVIMKSILVDIYSDNLLAVNLVFKGGTACYLFHGLPRFSVDLDFNLLNLNLIEEVFEKINKIAGKYGKIERPFIKRYTIFTLSAYEKNLQKVKIEISIRKPEEENYYEIKNFMGVSVLIMKKEVMFANKLVALSTRNHLANRDLFDSHWFFSRTGDWNIDEKLVEIKTGKKFPDYLEYLANFVDKNFKEATILDGLGELITAKQKDWVKKNLKKDLIFSLKNYREAIK